MFDATARPAHIAVVSHGEGAEYLRLDETGAPRWVASPHAATAFASMRDATRAAMRLPSTLRAFGLPFSPELELTGTRH